MLLGVNLSRSIRELIGNLSCWSCLQVNYTVTLQIAVVLAWKDMAQIQVTAMVVSTDGGKTWKPDFSSSPYYVLR